MSHTSGTATAGSVGGVWPPFTMAQWQELEHQAFIFKLLREGMPVPPDLIAPIRRSFESTSAQFFHHPSLGYSPLYGKKYDPEPGRCRRTDGKKWRCSKDAYPDSKYCERHMNRSRNRSRKPVESKTTPQSLSTVASGAATASSKGSASSQNLPLRSYSNHEDLYRRSNALQLQLESIPYGASNREYRGHNSIPEASNSSVSTEWCGQLGLSEARSGTLLQFNQPQLQDFVVDAAAMSKQQQQQEHYFFGMELNSQLAVKQDQSTLEPLFDQKQPEKKTQSTTQLSMSIPISFQGDLTFNQGVFQ